MRIILQEKIANLGAVGDQVQVKSGYARNYLLPFGKAVIATPGAITDFELRRADLEKAAARTLAQAQKRAENLRGRIITITANASEEGKLFGSIGPRDIMSAFGQIGIFMNKSEINLPEGSIRSIGEYKIRLQLHTEVSVLVDIIVKEKSAS